MRFLDAAKTGTVKRTSEGYIVAHAKALRTGIQDYLPQELGLMADAYPSGYVRVYRPDESVFDEAALSTMAQKPITVGHPDDEVSPENYAELAVGHVTNKFARDGEWVALEVMVTDKRGIEAIDSGTVELSAGYIADMHPVDHPDYDFVMGKPEFNHLALVPRGRAGHEARIGDNAKPWGAIPTQPKKEPIVELIKVQVGDKAVSVVAADADVVAAMAQDHAAAIEAKDEEIAALKIECADANKLVKTDAEIAQMVQDGVSELAEVADKARSLVADYDAAGKDAMTIRKEVIAAVYGDEAIADLVTDAEVKAAFKVAKSVAKVDPVLTRDAKPEPTEVKDNGQSAYEKRLNDAWKGAK